MTTSPGPAPVRSAQRGGEAVSRRPELAWLARVGLVARGVVYGIIGILALKLAVGSGGKATTQRGALQTIAREPFGKALLIAMAVGLDGALNKLSHNSYGPFLLGVVAAGLIGFALYSIADARYRKI